MATFTLEDPTGRIGCIIFPKQFQKFHHVFEEDGLISMAGRLDNRRDELQFACNEAKKVSLEAMIANAKENVFFDPKEKVSRQMRKLELEKVEEKKEEDVLEPTTEIEDIDMGESKSETLNSKLENFIIEVGDSKVANLPKLKELLMKHKGDGVAVEIHIKNGDGVKKVKVPFEVKMSDKLKKEVGGLI